MREANNAQISGLDGYLHCLGRLGANGSQFGVVAYEKIYDIDEFVLNLLAIWGERAADVGHEQYEYLGSEKITPKTLFETIDSFIFNGALDRSLMHDSRQKDYVTKMVSYDINEFYGVMSTSMNPSGEFHPLLAKDVHSLDIRCASHAREFYFLVEIENVYVVTSLVQKACRSSQQA